MVTTAVETRVLEGFDDPGFGRNRWGKLLADSDAETVYVTWEFQRSWWETLGRGQLLLIVAERDDQPVALAPFYWESGMIYFVGSSFELDCLDFVGDISDPEVLDALLETAREHVAKFLGFQFYFVPDGSHTGQRLKQAAARLGLSCYEEDTMAAPVLDLVGQPEFAQAATQKDSLMRYERLLRREASLEVRHMRDGEAILPHLDEFFQQHVARWDGRGNPSRFLYAKTREFFERLTQVAAGSGLLRFMRIDWCGRPIAFHYGYCHRSRYFWGVPSFAVDLARYSPGQILLRQLLLAAIEERASVFDFGTGDQAFKKRFATQINQVRTWGLYPSSRRLSSLTNTHEPASREDERL
jgi:CelD/BcsL family acetyltransferase involved in cellulose biosynthesis